MTKTALTMREARALIRQHLPGRAWELATVSDAGTVRASVRILHCPGSPAHTAAPDGTLIATAVIPRVGRGFDWRPIADTVAAIARAG